MRMLHAKARLKLQNVRSASLSQYVRAFRVSVWAGGRRRGERGGKGALIIFLSCWGFLLFVLLFYAFLAVGAGPFLLRWGVCTSSCCWGINGGGLLSGCLAEFNAN